MSSKITGLGIALPDREMSSAELAGRLGVTEEWITVRTGIHSRRIASGSETTDGLGRAAALHALSDAAIEPSDIDLVICATVTAEKRFPSVACLVQSSLGTTVPAFDIGAGCSGFLYALQVADAAIQAKNAERVLVVGTEVLSRVTDPADPKTSVLFGDGAGAAVVQQSPHGLAVGPIRLFSDGRRSHLLDVDPERDVIRMEGREVFRSAVAGMATSVARLLAEEGLPKDDIELVIAHQANQRILDAVAAKLGVDRGLLYSNIGRYGNTSAASIPIALYEARQEGLIEADSLVVLTAFGAGFTWGAGLLHGPLDRKSKLVPATAGARHV